MSPRGYGNPMRGPNSRDAEAVKKNAFRDQEILVISIKDPRLAWQEKKLLKQIGTKIYGAVRR